MVTRNTLNLPLIAVLSFAAFTLSLYHFGPIDWVSPNRYIFTVLIFIYYASFLFGYKLSDSNAKPSKFTLSKKIVMIGFILNLITIVPSIYSYTGRLPWDLTIYTQSAGENYSEFYTHIISRDTQSGFRYIQAIARAVAQPVITAGFIVGAFYFPKLTRQQKAALVASVFLQFIMSRARGTDKEIADMLILIGIPLLIANHKKIFRPKILATIACVLLLFFVSFSNRRVSRYGEIVPECFSYAEICLQKDSLPRRILGDTYGFGVIIFSAYLSQGYQGFSLALDLPHQLTYGVGHSPALTRLTESVLGVDIHTSTFNYRLRALGWDERYVWPTMFTWAANDLTFYGIPLLMLFFGYVMAHSWKDILFEQNDVSLIIFTLITASMLYASANNLLGSGLDMTFTWMFWLLIWIRNHIRMQHSIDIAHLKPVDVKASLKY